MANNIFEMVLERLEQDYPSSTLNAWFNDVSQVEASENSLVLHSSSEFKREHIQTRFTKPIENALLELTGQPVTLTVITGNYIASSKYNSPYDEYSFERFIVGSSNKMAHAAAIAVSKNPADVYNPLFIYGNSGLGKTHLMYAIAGAIAARAPNYQITYVKGEDFTNEFINSIEKGNMQSFRDKYRQIDLLLLDDIQFLAGRERTQEEFFHTFNTLYEAHKQIVLTSDRPPKEINTLENRLRTRFESGLIVDVQPPDFETRIAILRDKAMKINIILPNEVSLYIAEHIKSNVRQLEGVIKKIKAMNELMHNEINIATAQQALDALNIENPGMNPTPQRIMEVVGNYFYTPVERMLSNNRSKDVANARHFAMYLIRQELEYSFPDIAKLFGRDHTTILHACNKIEEAKKNSRDTRALLQKLHNIIREEG